MDDKKLVDDELDIDFEISHCLTSHTSKNNLLITILPFWEKLFTWFEKEAYYDYSMILVVSRELASLPIVLYQMQNRTIFCKYKQTTQQTNVDLSSALLTSFGSCNYWLSLLDYY